jgi:hypothetical protein
MSNKIFVIIMATMKRKRARKTKNRKRTRKTYKGGLYARLKVSPSNIVVDDNYFYSKLNQCKEILDDLSEKIPLLKDGKVLGSEIPLLRDGKVIGIKYRRIIKVYENIGKVCPVEIRNVVAIIGRIVIINLIIDCLLDSVSFQKVN